MKQIVTATIGALALAFAFTGPAPSAHAQGAMPGAKHAAAQEFVNAEVKKVDKDIGKVQLSHGEVKSLALPASTNIFDVRDPAMFSMLAEGAKVRVALAKSATGYVVVQVEPAA
jgi:Cu(I)/Ag(I) efflux system periplasmic protein CusF